MNVVSSGTFYVYIYRNISTTGTLNTSSFAAPVIFSGGGAGLNAPYGVAIGDVDGDGIRDLVIANSGGFITAYRNTNTPGAITSGNFSAPTTFTTGTNPYYLAMADLDGDGRLDVVTANGGTNTMSVFINTATPGVINASSFAPKIDFTSTNAGP